MTEKRIDFRQIADAALSASERLVPRWLPDGAKIGHEWQSTNPTRGDRHRGSFSVNLTTGAWADFAVSDAKGGDLISLYAYLFTDRSMGKAARELARELNIRLDDTSPQRAAAPPKPREKSPWQPVTPAPADAPSPPVAHVKRGRPEQVWCYRNAPGEVLGYVYRFRTSDGGKDLIPLVWAHDQERGRAEWRWMQWAAPRPLYGLDRLRPGHPVLIVEGEKCADAAHEVFGAQLDVVSWPGGGKAADKADWSVLAGRKVLIWPDCDAQLPKGVAEGEHVQPLPEDQQPGTVTAERIAVLLAEQGAEVRIVVIPPPGAKPSGWDVADAVAEGMTREALQAILLQHRAPRSTGEQGPGPTSAAQAEVGDDEPWSRRMLYRRGEVVACLANVVLILSCHEHWQGVVARDEFAARTVKLKPLPGQTELGDVEWTDVDTSRTIIWLTRRYGMTPGAEIVDQAIELVAADHAFHPVRRYLAGLPAWDGVDRCEHWLADYMGVALTPYSRLVARWFLLGMIARVMRPGIKFDYALVLEGAQGRRKSSALRVLAGEWFSDTELDLTHKDSMSALRGKWLHEFAELGSLARTEERRQKSFLARQVDEFRPPYGRREIRCPRQLVFAGTTNEWAWNKDPTGGRRFWPVEITQEIDTEGLEGVRDQLFAEALHRWKANERFWPTADEQRTLFDPEQLAREAEDSFFDPIHDWIEELWRPEFTMHDVMADALKLDAGRQTRDVATRVGQLLKKMGCKRVERRNGVSRFVYLLPEWAKHSKQKATQSAAADLGRRDGDMPL